MILLDTNAFIWLDQGHARTRPLVRSHLPLHLSPVTLLELQFLQEAGRIRIKKGSLQSVLEDDRWILDDPPAASWFLRATDLGWTRDPFDRLLVAHAQLRGWRLATADEHLLKRIGPAACFEL